MRGALAWAAGANLALLILFPVAWAAPLARTGFLPWFEGDAVSVLSGVAALWEADRVLAFLVALFGIALPYAKTLALAAVHAGGLGPRALPALELLGKLSMADVFLIALAIVIAKGVGVGRVEPAWGLHLFAACVLGSLAASIVTARALR
ncbi:MAG: paraquat-inducible protein A [Pseudomonadota bacterium]